MGMSDSISEDDEGFEIIGSNRKLVDSLRSSNYKNTTYAIAELIDNSVDASAHHIEILCKDMKNYETGRNNLHEVAVLDDGVGMEENPLRRSLKFGDGKDPRSDDLGKFGMGLPNASISQCRRVEIYTWTNTIDDALYTYIDTEMIPHKMKSVPKPVHKKIPNEWKNASKYLSKKSGTLVIWSKIDRASYKTSNALIKNSTSLIGRIYRKFLHGEPDNKTAGLVIRTASFTASNGQVSIINEDDAIKPNDPLYLMAPSQTPKPWDDKPMFEKYGNDDVMNIPYKGKNHTVNIRYTIVRGDVRKEDQSGATEFGKHADDNMGISIVRSGRELDLDTSIKRTHEYRDRWWGVEIEFPPSLDELFGVSYVKQSASNFSDTLKNYDKIIDVSGKDEHQSKRELEGDGEHDKIIMIKLVHKIMTRVKNMLAAVKLERKGTRKDPKTPGKKPEDIAGESQTSETGTGQDVKNIPKNERIENAKRILMEEGFSVIDAEHRAKESIEAGEKFVWLPANLSGDQFFDVVHRSSTGQLYIKLNIDHAAYKNLAQIVENVPNNLNANEAIERLRHVHTGLRLLIASWAEFEDQTLNDDQRRQIQNFRISWGTLLDDFLKQNSL